MLSWVCIGSVAASAPQKHEGEGKSQRSAEYPKPGSLSNTDMIDFSTSTIGRVLPSAVGHANRNLCD